MNHAMGPLERILEFLYSIGLPPMRILRMLITIVVIGLLIGGIWFFAFNEDSDRSARRSESGTEETTADDTSVGEDRVSYDFELSIDQRIDEMLYFDPTQAGYVIVASEFEKQKLAIAELEQQAELSEEQKRRLKQIELRNCRMLIEMQMEGGIDATDSMKALEDLAQTLSNDQHEPLKNLANYSLAKTSATRLAYFTTEENARLTTETLRKCKTSFVNNRRRAQTLLNQIDQTRKSNSEKPFVGECFEDLGKILLTSSLDDVVELGRQVTQFSLFKDFDLGTLENRIRYRAPKALKDLDKALRTLEANPDVDSEYWQLLMRCYEASLSTKTTRDFNIATGIFSDMIKQLPDSDVKKADLVQRLGRQQKRFEMIGTKFEIAGKSIRNRKIAPSSNEYTLLVFAGRDLLSIELMSELMKRGTDGGTFRPIIAFQDPFTEDDMTKLNAIPSWAYVATEETAQKLMESLSVDTFPYTFLIDKQGIVVEANVSVVQAQNRIAAIEKKKREARFGK